MLKALVKLPPDVLQHILSFVSGVSSPHDDRSGNDSHIVCLIDGKWVVLIKKI